MGIFAKDFMDVCNRFKVEIESLHPGASALCTAVYLLKNCAIAFPHIDHEAPDVKWGTVHPTVFGAFSSLSQ